MQRLMYRAVLVLNQSCEPLRFIAVRKALKMITKGKALVKHFKEIEVYPGVMLPSTIILAEYRRVPHQVRKLSRRNILQRDDHRCQYCGRRPGSQGLTLDHVVPKSRGGKNAWENLVACCGKCNHRKADRTPEEAGMTMLRRPMPANIHTSRSILRALSEGEPEWEQYMFADAKYEAKHLSFTG